jgi:ubiquinone/menaquinone biosynthesis C-methylase UbiE
MGHFLNNIEADVEMVVGSEINKQRLTFVREELGFDVYEGTDELLETFKDGSFDIITMFHTLEHLPNPVEQLQYVRRLLSDEGTVIFEVPNHNDWLLSLSNAYADFYYQEAHAHYFDPQTLEDVLDRAGFNVEVRGAQRYSYRNALHWLVYGEPELNAPSRFDDSGYSFIEKGYGKLIKMSKRSDTIIAQGSPR